MSDIVRFDHICQYLEFLGVETLHPLVSVVDLSKAQMLEQSRYLFGFYTMFLKDVKCGDLVYGRNYYDYQEGTLVFLAPGQIIGVADPNKKVQPKGWALLFHPDFIKGTSLGRNIREYTFFSYEVREALHISEQERKIVTDCLERIQIELSHGIDRHSRRLINTSIELLLDYCTRFYERQFITRENVNKDILIRFESLLSHYFESDKPQTVGLPSVAYCASELNLSANYLGDLIKKETGVSAQEHIQLAIIDLAKERVFDTSKSVSQIAYELGFKYPQHFSRMFKKQVGLTPNEYRSQN